MIEASLQRASWAKLQEHLKTAPFTLCHGDFHASNMFLRVTNGDSANDSEPRIVMFDWSEVWLVAEYAPHLSPAQLKVGPWDPTADLAQTMISDVRAAVFVKHSKDLIRGYWEHLTRSGVDPVAYPFATCWSSFCQSGAERWIWLFCVLASYPGIPAVAVQVRADN